MKTLKYIALWIVASIGFSMLSIIVLPYSVFYFRKNLPRFFRLLAIAADQQAGAYLYGVEDVTVSSYTYIKSSQTKRHNAFMKFIDFFAFIISGEKNHCKNSYLIEIQ